MNIQTNLTALKEASDARYVFRSVFFKLALVQTNEEEFKLVALDNLHSWNYKKESVDEIMATLNKFGYSYRNNEWIRSNGAPMERVLEANKIIESVPAPIPAADLSPPTPVVRLPQRDSKGRFLPLRKVWTFDYTNMRGETLLRRVVSSKESEKDGTYLEGFDLTVGGFRRFFRVAMRNVVVQKEYVDIPMEYR